MDQEWQKGFPSEIGTYIWMKSNGVKTTIKLNQTRANIYEDVNANKTRTFMATDRDNPRHGKYRPLN